MLSIILKARLQFYANKNCIITAILNEKKYHTPLKLIAPHNTKYMLVIFPHPIQSISPYANPFLLLVFVFGNL